MKLWAELAFFAKRLEKGILSTPFTIWKDKYVLSVGRIYSDLIFENDLTWVVLEQAYKNAVCKDNVELTKSVVEQVNTWTKIGLEDINTFDAIWNVAWIEWSNYWIDIKIFIELQWMITKSWYFDVEMRISEEWMLAFIHSESQKLFLITSLQTIQRSLIN